MWLRLLALLVAVCCASAAHAQVNYIYNTVAASCTPDHATIKTDQHRAGVASVQHAVGKIDRIILTCQVGYYEGAATNWVLGMTYDDSTGTGTTAYVRARLYRLAYGSTTPQQLTFVSSDSCPNMFTNTTEKLFPYTFNADANIYFIRVEMDRSEASQNVVLHSLYIRQDFGNTVTCGPT